MILLDLAAQAQVAVVVPPIAEETVLSVEFSDIDAEDAFKSVAERLGMVAQFEKGMVQLREPRTVAQAVTAIRSGFEEAPDLARVLEKHLGARATVQPMGDRVFVSGDDDTVQRVESVRPFVDIGPDGWLLEVVVVQLSERFASAIGLSWSMSGQVRSILGDESLLADGAFTGLAALAAVEMIAEASESSREAALLTSARLFVLEGQDASLQQGDVIPIPRRTVSNFGVVETTGFDYVNTGFTLRVSAKRVPGGVRLALEPSLSSVTGFVEQAPIVTTSRVSSSVVVVSGEWLVLSGLESSTLDREESGIPGVGGAPWFGREGINSSSGRVAVLVKATRVFASSGERIQPIDN